MNVKNESSRSINNGATIIQKGFVMRRSKLIWYWQDFLENEFVTEFSCSNLIFVCFNVAPLDTAGDIVQRISDRLGLNPIDGWALYQVLDSSLDLICSSVVEFTVGRVRSRLKRLLKNELIKKISLFFVSHLVVELILRDQNWLLN